MRVDVEGTFLSRPTYSSIPTLAYTSKQFLFLGILVWISNTFFCAFW